MAEVLSLQMTKVAANPEVKLQPSERNGRSRIMFGQVASIAAAIADTIYFGRIPAGARITGAWLNNAAGTASSTLALSLRKSSDKTVISGTITAAAAISSAQKVDGLTGTLTNAGQSYIKPYEVDVVGTIAGAATPASPGQLISVIVDYVID
ncbi:hypothetical protein [Caballeronia sp. dw_19]|uniref:hypothetical protein n=1 Tax=Caballeronia sp. dw_19 TaxID=2719791 RepID=UPI001BD3D424|nr:hypothetical protein [Caballeronia sp. dw_19]